MMSVPQQSEQEQFFRAIFGQEAGYLFVSTLDRELQARDPEAKAWKDEGFAYPANLSAALAYCRQSDEAGLEVYVAAQLYKDPQRRKKDRVKVCPSAWSDLDTAAPFGMEPEPSVILETSPGRYHGFWRAAWPMGATEAEELSRRIAYALHRKGADLGGWDLTQVLRIPGTRNKKYDERPIVKLVKCDPTPIAAAKFDVLPPAPARASSSPSAPSDLDPPVKLTGFDLEHWQKSSTDDRSGWAMRMVAILKEHGLSDRLVEVALANHPIYLSKAREKWGNRESLIYDDIRRCIQHWKDNPAIQLVAPPAQTKTPTPDGSPPEEGIAASASDYPLQSLAELLRSSDADAGQLVEGILWAQRVHWAFSAPNVGKTLFLLAMGMHIAAGKPFCGRSVVQGPVLFIEEDSPLSVLADYTEFLADLYGFDLDSLPFRVNAIQGLRMTSEAGLTAAIGAFEAVATEFERPLAATMIDAAERLVPSDKFSTRELDYLTKFLQYAVGRKSTPVVIDHTKRPTMYKGKTVQPEDPMELLYGARAKSAISDAMIYFSGGLKIGTMCLTYVKFRGETPDPVDVTFTGEDGFGIGRPKPTSRTKTEQKIIAWFNNVGGLDWYWLRDIISGADVPERSGKRAIVAMTKRGMLRRDESASGQAARYRLMQPYDGLLQ